MVSVTRKDPLRAAIAHGTTALVVAHNHPFGYTVPSPADGEFTRGLLDAVQLVGLELLDHVIFGPRRWTSLRETTDLWR